MLQTLTTIPEGDGYQRTASSYAPRQSFGLAC